jgi:putative membrane protein
MPSDLGTEQRLHPSSVIFGVGSAAGRLLLPGLVVLFASRGSNYEIWLMLLFIPAVLGSLVRYFSFRYRLGDEEMVVREGILTRNERHIPYARIQNIDLVQNPVHRWLNVAVARLETASGGKPEAVIRVLSLDAVQEMRRRVFRGRDGTDRPLAEGATIAGAEPVAAEVMLQLPTGELVRQGLISNRGMAVVAAGMGLLWQSGLFDDDALEAQLAALFKNVSWLEGAQHRAVAYALLAGGVLLALLVAVRLLSVVWAIVKLHGFTLTRRGDDLRAEYGLLTRVSATIPRHRIQLLSTRSTPLHRLFRRAAIQVETAGGSDGDGEGGGSSEKLWLAPLIPADRVERFVGRIIPEVDLGRLDWQPVAPRTRRRLFRRGLIVSLLLGAGGFAAFGAWGLSVVAPAAALVWARARLYVRHTGYAITDRAVVYRSGWWVRRLSLVRVDKIQSLALTQSPFDRLNAMASLLVDTAGGGRIGHRVDMAYLEETVARRIAERLYAAASVTAFRW